jgi:predicted TIM-barrel fold metal-dependent hydrolase
MPQILTNSYVDSHLHIFQAGRSVAGARYQPAYSAALNEWTELAGSLSVGRGVLIQPSFLGDDNSHLIAALRENRDRLRGVVVLPEQSTLRQMQQLHSLGVRGIRLNCVGTNHQLETLDRQTHLIDALIQLGWHVELHTDQGQLPGVIAQLASQVVLVIDHMGKPASSRLDDDTFVCVAKRNRQSPVYVKLSGAYRLNGLNAQAITDNWLNLVGPNQLLWGSDWPCTNFEPLADYTHLFLALKTWVTDPNVLQKVLVDNPNRLFWDSV